MIKSKYDSRAAAINPNSQRLIPVEPASEFWDRNVHSKEDVVNFYKTYYPELPDVAVEALARRIQSAVDGKLELSQEWIKDKQIGVAQELMSEISQQRQIGLKNLKEKQQHELLIQPEERPVDQNLEEAEFSDHAEEEEEKV